MMLRWNWWSSPQADDEARLHHERLGIFNSVERQTYYEPKNKEGPEEGQPDGQENESKEEESREGRFIMR